jgi:hypothetical protein
MKYFTDVTQISEPQTDIKLPASDAFIRFERKRKLQLRECVRVATKVKVNPFYLNCNIK